MTRTALPGYARPACVVLTPQNEDLSTLLTSGQNANGLGPHGYVYEDLRIIEATRRLVAERSEWRIPEMNRELVESATHPDALEAIARQMGEKWVEHSLAVEGGALGDGLTARRSTVRRDKTFFGDNREVAFPRDDERIRTRLGDDRIDIELAPPQSSPLGAAGEIESIAMSVRWLPEGQAPKSVEPATGPAAVVTLQTQHGCVMNNRRISPRLRGN